MKNTWSVIKEVIGKTKIRSSNLPRRLVLNGIETYDKTTIANGFNDYFSSIGEKLAKNTYAITHLNLILAEII